MPVPERFFLVWLAFLTACSAPEQATESGRTEPARPEDRVSEFVRRIHQDRQGHLWIGTNGDGVLRHDGEALETFGPEQGFGGDAVRAIVEEERGHLWFGTSGGVTRYDGQSFTNYTLDDGLPSQDVWCLCLDRSGVLWVGTLLGACRWDPGEARFTSFYLPPAAEADLERGVSSRSIVHSIVEDSKGGIWLAQSTAGVYRYHGGELSLLSAADGLPDGSVNCVLEDRQGRMWFATHHGGVCRYDGERVEDVSGAAGARGTEAWDLFLDAAGNVWFPIEREGLFRFDGTRGERFGPASGLSSPAVQCTFQDRRGRIWCGGYTGLYRLEGSRFVHVGRGGPW